MFVETSYSVPIIVQISLLNSVLFYFYAKASCKCAKNSKIILISFSEWYLTFHEAFENNYLTLCFIVLLALLVSIFVIFVFAFCDRIK